MVRYPNINTILFQNLRKRTEPIEIKSALFMLITHRILKLNVNEDEIVFNVAKNQI